MTFFKKLNQKFHFDTLANYFFKTQINFLGPAFAYYTLLTILPGTLVIGVTLNYLGVSEAWFVTALRQILPKSIENIVLPIVHQVLGPQNVIWYTAAIIVTIWMMGGLLGILRQTFNRIYNYKEVINDFFSRFMALMWFALILTILFILISLATIGSTVIHSWLQNVPTPDLFDDSFTYILFALIFAFLFMLNYFLPLKRQMIRFTIIGTMIQSILIFALNKVFNSWAQYAIERYSFFQALAAIILLLFYLNLIGILMISGQVMTAWLQNNFKKDRPNKTKL